MIISHTICRCGLVDWKTQTKFHFYGYHKEEFKLHKIRLICFKVKHLNAMRKEQMLNWISYLYCICLS